MYPDNDVPYSSYSVDFFGTIGRIFFGSGDASDTIAEAGSFFAMVVGWVSIMWSFFTFLSLLLSAVLLFGIIYAYIRSGQLDEAQEEFIAAAERSYRELHGVRTTNWRWDEIQGRITSDNPNDWKLAIIDADVMLFDTLESAGYTGATVGDKLKGASSRSFTTLDIAWNAHKVRNQVAHSGTDFVLTKKLAQETVTQYRMVFEEFGVI